MHLDGRRRSDPIAGLRQSIADAAGHVRENVRGLQTALRRQLLRPDAADEFTFTARATHRVNRLAVRGPNFAAIIPGDSVAEAVITSGISSTLNLYQTVLIARLILTWFPNPPQAIVGPLATICDPYLNLFRGIIPPIGGTIDLSPILAFVVLDFFTGTSAALPAELPKEEAPAAAGAATR